MAPVIIDNLHKFGLEFQIKIIAGILTDKTFLERVVDIIDIDMFENEAHRWIVKEIIQYHAEYKSVPSTQAFKIRAHTIESDDFKHAVARQLSVIYQKFTETDLQFVREQFLEFCKNQKLKSAIMQSVDFLSAGEYDKIKSIVDQAMKAGMERNLGHNYHEELPLRMSEMCRKTIPTGWPVIDSLMDGGLGPGELGVIVAPAGIGKSWLLCSLGARAMRSGKNIAHFTLELNEGYVGLRYDCCFTGIDFQQIKHEQHAVEEKIKTIKGKLFVKYFPLKTVSAQSLKFHIERIQVLQNFHIDEMVVDYADILRQIEKEKNANSYSEMGGIYEELRQAAGELQIPCWTASQTNRCLSLDTTVDIDGKGTVEARNLVEGDKINTHLGYKTITKIFPIETQPTYRIKLKSGKFIDCSARHLFPTQYGKYKNIQTGLKVGDKLFTKK